MNLLKPLLFATLVLAMAVGSIQTAVANTLGAKTGQTAISSTQRVAELQIKNLIEPLLDKYCHEECKLMGINVQVDIAVPDEVAPGFDDLDPKSAMQLAPSSATIKLLVDEKVGPISRSKLMDIIQQYLDTLDYPVRVEVQVSRFPQPVGSAGKIAELRDRVTRQFRSTLDDLFKQFCPEHCLLADYDLKTDVVNAEEIQYGGTGEFLEDSGVAIKIKDITGTILVDESLSPQEQANILEMAKLKTNFFKNVSLTAKSLKFPRPPRVTRDANGNDIAIGPNGQVRNLASSEKTEKKLSEQFNNKTTNSSDSTSKSNFETNNQNSSTSKLNSNSESNNNTTNQNNETTAKQERFERFEKIERVENGDAVQKELDKFKVYGLIFACSILSLLIFIAAATYKPKNTAAQTLNTVQRVIHNLAGDPNEGEGTLTQITPETSQTPSDRNARVAKRYEIERLKEELMEIFAQNPKVAKYVFSRILTEEGVETTAYYIHIFGESIVIDMLRDPSLQSDMNELMEYYAKNPIEMDDEDKLELLKRLYNRAIAGKLIVMGSRSSNLFEFLAEMDGMQILELIRNESMTVKSIILTQCDPQKRATIFSQLDEDMRFKLMTELSRIDYLPREYIFNVATALKRKRKENPKLNTEALPGSDVLLNLLERTGPDMQRTVVKNLELTNPESARAIKNKLVSLDTLRFLRDGQLLEVVLSLKHDELLQFLKGTTGDVRNAIFAKSPKDLVSELEDELASVTLMSREAYQAVERKIMNRMKMMAQEGLINLVETNDRMLSETKNGTPFVEAGPAGTATNTEANLKKVAGW